jgi:hypothetical protein
MEVAQPMGVLLLIEKTPAAQSLESLLVIDTAYVTDCPAEAVRVAGEKITAGARCEQVGGGGAVTVYVAFAVTTELPLAAEADTVYVPLACVAGTVLVSIAETLPPGATVTVTGEIEEVQPVGTVELRVNVRGAQAAESLSDTRSV